MDSPRKATAKIGIQISMVLLIMLDSTADNVCRVRFQSVKAIAVFTTASQMMIPQPCKSMLGIPSIINPTKSSRTEPTPMLTTVMVSGCRS